MLVPPIQKAIRVRARLFAGFAVCDNLNRNLRLFEPGVGIPEDNAEEEALKFAVNKTV